MLKIWRTLEPSAAAVQDWVKQAVADGGEYDDRLTSAELDELRQLRKEVRQLRQERDIFSKTCPLMAPFTADRLMAKP